MKIHPTELPTVYKVTVQLSIATNKYVHSISKVNYKYMMDLDKTLKTNMYYNAYYTMKKENITDSLITSMCKEMRENMLQEKRKIEDKIKIQQDNLDRINTYLKDTNYIMREDKIKKIIKDV